MSTIGPNWAAPFAGQATARCAGWPAAAWSVITVLLVGTTVWGATLGLVRLGLAGDEVHLRLAQCQTEGGGRGGGSYVQCSGQLVGDKSTDTVKIRHDDQQGEVVPAYRSELREGRRLVHHLQQFACCSGLFRPHR
ncbi:hypothetical protein ADK54_30290 [Streptomyces sp. WM6378]|nr:hypothetical protein ADK54_30290 [Streptomyces sp. WM6378]